jgi:hypothetical protein
MYETMGVSRRFEEAVAEIYLEGKKPVFNMANGPIPCEMHLSNGQEPCAVRVCAHLTAEDVVTATHRPHHHASAKGVDLRRMAGAGSCRLRPGPVRCRVRARVRARARARARDEAAPPTHLGGPYAGAVISWVTTPAAGRASLRADHLGASASVP